MKTVDLFAGWGGFTEGAEQAGAEVVWAANHWPLAVRAHEHNHPRTIHACQDLRQADWSQLPEYDLLLAAPACQGHSQAAQPGRARCEKARRRHDAFRATAWAVVDCAEATKPQAIVVENVVDFRRWQLYPRWLACLQDLGYSVSENILTATDFGVPQRRRRLFVVASRNGEVDIQVPTVAREPPFEPCIDWDAAGWSPISTVRHAGACRRLQVARERFGQAMVQHVSHHRGLPLDQPIRTITTQDQWALVDGRFYRPLTIRETARAMGFGDHYGWPEGVGRRNVIRGLGNAVCPPVAREIVEQVQARLGYSSSREAA